MTRVKIFLLQLTFILLVSMIPSLLILRIYPSKDKNQVFAQQIAAESGALSSGSDRDGSSEYIPAVSTKSSPDRIYFPRLAFSLAVAEGEISGGVWQVYDDKASWLSTSAVPGEGNVIIYGHNRKHIFGTLHDLQVGDEIQIEHEGNLYVYKVSEKQYVSPKETDAVVSDENQLTLYTCEGTFDQRRLVVVAVAEV